MAPLIMAMVSREKPPVVSCSLPRRVRSRVRAASVVSPAVLLLFTSCEIQPQAAPYFLWAIPVAPSAGRVEMMSVRPKAAAIPALASPIVAGVRVPVPMPFALLKASSVRGVTAAVTWVVAALDSMARRGVPRGTVAPVASSVNEPPVISSTTGPW